MLKEWIFENRRGDEILNHNNQPNGNTAIVDSLYLSQNIKNIMNHVAEKRMASLEKGTEYSEEIVNLQSKLSTQQDLESSWAQHWLNELKVPFTFHRKNWENAFILQVLHDHDMFGKHGLGLACGQEKIPSYLIQRNCTIVAGDRPFCNDDAIQNGWESTNQYTLSKESLYHEDLTDRSHFNNNFTLKYVDMNSLPTELHGDFDFCWSVCAMEHLGSIAAGLNFLKNSLKLLKPGGISVHTTEFNLLSSHRTIDNWGSVLFTREHLSILEKEIKEIGGEVYPFNFDMGNGLFDCYFDMPPFPHQSVTGIDSPLPLLKFTPHIKLLIDGIPATCVGIIIKKNWFFRVFRG
ncbi:MAG: hypothetical protein BCS36_03125 [Desulfovibrio sp. MES5]|nr:MAG: hypothetical protein BCS36_03125 [Desulfovibrio sp. MES5]